MATTAAFLQDGVCGKVAPKLAKCRECRGTPKDDPNQLCRFDAFRRLCFVNGRLVVAGFMNPVEDSTEEDLRLWLPSPDWQPANLTEKDALVIVTDLGDQLCELVAQERLAATSSMSKDKTIAWKRVVPGIREMCDVCETTIFNFHWSCRTCGFVVCIDCYLDRKSDSVKIWGYSDEEGKDSSGWLYCTRRTVHKQGALMLTQMVAGDSLFALGRLVHEVRGKLQIPQNCCYSSQSESLNMVEKYVSMQTLNGLHHLHKENKKFKEKDSATNGDANMARKRTPSLLFDAAIEYTKSGGCSDADNIKGDYSILRELLNRPSHEPNNSRSSSPRVPPPSKKSQPDTLDDVISLVIEHSVVCGDNGDEVDAKAGAAADAKAGAAADAKAGAAADAEPKHFVRRSARRGRDPLPYRVMNLCVSKLLYPDVPHMWLCDGRLLRLTDPTHRGNATIFRDQWSRGQPVIVSNVSNHLDKSLWTPDSFSREFGHKKNDLVNCITGKLVPQQPMRKFWDGFEHFSKRLKDKAGTSMLLKLKDWPAGDDFADVLTSRFEDLMRVLPMPEYTHRTGALNLVSQLPDCFVRPDLGPKMYNAYGSALHREKGTTNIHLDISDAVNVMVYVGIPKDGDDDHHIEAAFRLIDEAGCDFLTRRRVRELGEMPGALWHIYHACDSDKIRDLLNKVSVETGLGLEPRSDPIHDQSWYLDAGLRERLYKEYGVQGYAIVQCLGDSVFIPAGAPHQRDFGNMTAVPIAEEVVDDMRQCLEGLRETLARGRHHATFEDVFDWNCKVKKFLKDTLSHAVRLNSSFRKRRH